MQVDIRKTKQPFHKRTAQHRRAHVIGTALSSSATFKETEDSFGRQPGSCPGQRRSLVWEWCQRSHPCWVGKKHLSTEVVDRWSPTHNTVLHSNDQQRSQLLIWLITMWPCRQRGSTHKRNPANDSQLTTKIINMLMGHQGYVFKLWLRHFRAKEAFLRTSDKTRCSLRLWIKSNRYFP